MSELRKDFIILMSARVLRAFGFGFSAILVAVHLEQRGLRPTTIGIFLGIALAAASLTGLLAAAATGWIGRRRTLALIGLMMAACGVDLALARQEWLLMLAAVTGMVGAASTDLGPFLPVEQALLTQTTSTSERNRAFARYSLTGALAGAAGGFASGAAASPTVASAFFLLFAALGLATALLALFLSAEIEGQNEGHTFGSLRPLLTLSGLFAVDSLGGGLVVNSVIVFWLHIRFGASPALLGPSFAVMSVLSALSLEAAGRLADRIGLVNTMVFTHLPSNLLLFLIPFAPNLGVAIAVLLVRSTLVSMDQPTRQAYVVSIVKPSERSGALAVTGSIRGVAQGIGPTITGLAIQAAALGIPFFVGGGLKTCYDLALYAGFRRRFGEHERQAPAGGGAGQGG